MIRKHKPSDLGAILNVWLQASTLAHPFLKDEFVETVKKAMRETYIPNSETWVYVENSVILGFIGMQGNEIGGLFVLPIHQSKGVGRTLVNFILEQHDQLEVEVFEKNKIGIPFYTKFGFTTYKQYIMEETGEQVFRMKFTKPT